MFVYISVFSYCIFTLFILYIYSSFFHSGFKVGQGMTEGNRSSKCVMKLVMPFCRTVSWTCIQGSIIFLSFSTPPYVLFKQILNAPSEAVIFLNNLIDVHFLARSVSLGIYSMYIHSIIVFVSLAQICNDYELLYQKVKVLEAPCASASHSKWTEEKVKNNDLETHIE